MPPPGDYAKSCVGRERMFEYFSAQHGTPGRLFRLNYAIDMRYGVLHDVGRKVRDGEPIDLAMGHVNVIWQGDANTVALRCLAHATDADHADQRHRARRRIEVRWLAGEFGKLLGKTPKFTGKPAPTGWLNNAARMVKEFGPPSVPLAKMIEWTADWLGARHGHAQQAHALRGARWQVLRRCDRRRSTRQCEAVWPLSIEAGWNQNVADWRFMLGAGRGFGCRGADGRWEASSLVLPLGQQLAWISMVLVTKAGGAAVSAPVC